MHSGAKRRLDISNSAPRLGLTKLAAAATRGVLTMAVISGLLLISPRKTQAQTENVLYNFTGGADGAYPQSRLTPDDTGNFYGTTQRGGLGYGTVFELSPNGTGGWNETVLYSFTGGADGSVPDISYVVFDKHHNLYGTTSYGGSNACTYGCGVVFELSRSGSSWTETVLYSFVGGLSGYYPAGGLIMDTAGNIYGALSNGGADGAVFELSPSGGGWTEKVIYSPTDLIYAGGLTMDASGNIFGATESTVFELSPNGTGGWNPTVIHTFTGAPKDGSYEVGTPVLDRAGSLYGTTYLGGTDDYGTVYELSPRKTGKWAERILHSFKGGTSDGSNPWAGIVFDTVGNIYGNTGAGGAYGDGTVFELVATVGVGPYEEKVLLSFDGTNGSQAIGSLILGSAGSLYGTTNVGGEYGYGVAFKLIP
jgi:uncharacterized repeat protein (TIGR03803 family)